MATDWPVMGRSVIGLTAPGAQLLLELTESEINCFDAQKPLSVSPKVVLIPVIAHGYLSNLWKISGKWFSVDRSSKYPVVFLLWLCGSILLLMVPPVWVLRRWARSWGWGELCGRRSYPLSWK
jgi:hypothetical protein